MKMRSTIKALLLVSAAAVGAQSASAADLPARPAYKAPVQIISWDWTGPYLGVYAGIAASRSRSLDPTGAIAGVIEHTGYGFTGGGTIGYNWQTSWNIMGGAIVVGLEGDLGYFDAGRSARDWNTATVAYDHDTTWLGTARGRVGLAVGPNLTYFTGGYAALGIDDRFTNPVTGVTVASDKVKSGYALGSGIETMLGGGWTAKSEYMFADFGDGDTLVNGGVSLQSDRLRYHSQRFGVNYLFGAGNRGPLPQTNWNGFYLAGVYGVGLSSTRGTGTDGGVGGELGNNGSGLQAGGQLGWNWMLGPRMVVGVEGDVSYYGLDHTSHNFADNGTSHFKLDATWFATARGRLGYSTGPALLYVTGGGAWMGIEQSLTSAGGTVSTDKTLSGWTIGGGIEAAMGNNWSTKTEYLFVDLGNGDTLAGVGAGAGLSITPDYQFHMFRSALVYRFK
jgi:outer membrane immunogenic protein